MNPTTLEEWEEYIETFEVEELVQKAKSANTMIFAEVLYKEGWGQEKIKALLTLFGRRMSMFGAEPPRYGLYSYAELISLDPLSNKKVLY